MDLPRFACSSPLWQPFARPPESVPAATHPGWLVPIKVLLHDAEVFMFCARLLEESPMRRSHRLLELWTCSMTTGATKSAPSYTTFLGTRHQSRAAPQKKDAAEGDEVLLRAVMAKLSELDDILMPEVCS